MFSCVIIVIDTQLQIAVCFINENQKKTLINSKPFINIIRLSVHAWKQFFLVYLGIQF